MKEETIYSGKLVKVTYDLFETEAAGLRELGQAEEEIDREIRLSMENGDELFISWHREPVQYAIGWQKRTWFSDNAHRIDVSDTKIWKRLMGRPIKLLYLDKDHQVLEIRSQHNSVYCSAHANGKWMCDMVHISLRKPDLPSC